MAGIKAIIIGCVFGLLVGMASAPSKAEIPTPAQKPSSPAATQSVPLPVKKPDSPKASKPESKDKKSAKAGNAQIAASKPFELTSKPLSKNDIALYKQIFALQADGNMETANKAIKSLNDHRLYGHVLYQRYLHPTAYSSTFEELKEWLDHYGDLPGAYKIYALAQRKKPDGYKGELKEPQNRVHIIRRHEPTMVRALKYVPSRKRSDAQMAVINTLRRDIQILIRKDSPSKALKLLKKADQDKLLDDVEYDTIIGDIAASYLYNGKIKEAYALASKSASRSGLHVPRAGWVAGLSAWVNKDYDSAARYFEIVGRSTYASAWTKAAGAYWAARSHMRTGDVRSVSIWLERAVAYPRTFYGLIATRALGRDFDFNWKVPTFTKDYFNALVSTPGGFRAMALADIGQNALAEAELIRMNLDEPKLREAMLAYAGYARLPGLAMRLGSNVLDTESEGYYDAALYPTGPFEFDLKDDAKSPIDPALIHAIMRQESRFDPAAESGSGAKGLMQIMPSTAQSINADKAEALDDPQTNIELGRRYLETLLKDKSVKNDLFKLLVAYNAGPGNLQKWLKRFPETQDPLLFIELIPVAETRGYVERVLANYWIYRLRDDLPTPTLDAVTSGKPAAYGASRN